METETTPSRGINGNKKAAMHALHLDYKPSNTNSCTVLLSTTGLDGVICLSACAPPWCHA